MNGKGEGRNNYRRLTKATCYLLSLEGTALERDLLTKGINEREKKRIVQEMVINKLTTGVARILKIAFRLT